MTVQKTMLAAAMLFTMIGAAHAAVEGQASTLSIDLGERDGAAGVIITGVTDTYVGFGAHLAYYGEDTSGIYNITSSTDLQGITDHPHYGIWHFDRVGSGNDVWFGEWYQENYDSSGNENGTANTSTKTVYYAGSNPDSSISATGRAVQYSVVGLSNYAGSGSTGSSTGYYSGTFTANFSSRTLSGSLTGSGSTLYLGSGTNGSVAINSDASITGSANWGGSTSNLGSVQGQFYNGQTDLAGFVNFSGTSSDIAFGGSTTNTSRN